MTTTAMEGKMKVYDFTFIASGVDPESPTLVDRFFEAGCDDATLAFMRGRLAVCFAREAENYSHAVVTAYRDVLRAGANVERFEPDFLVNANEIADRSGLTRAAISLYSKGSRGEGFPSPYAKVTSESPLWDWVQVSGWLYKNGKLPIESVVNARIDRAVNRFVTSAGVKNTDKLFHGQIFKTVIQHSAAA
jgi:hypothetical protein